VKGDGGVGSEIERNSRRWMATADLRAGLRVFFLLRNSLRFGAAILPAKRKGRDLDLTGICSRKSKRYSVSSAFGVGIGRQS
jgi:hypothetical protein